MKKGGMLFLNRSFNLFLVVLIGFGVYSCRSAKKITTAISTKDSVQRKADTAKRITDTATAEILHADSLKYIQQLYSQIKSKTIDCRTFSAKLKVHYEGSDGKNYEFN